MITIPGNTIHPGSAKDKMINASLLAMQLHSLLPVEMNPAYTEGCEGINHLLHIKGECELATMTYLIRNHDAEKFAKQKRMFIDACAFIGINVTVKEHLN